MIIFTFLPVLGKVILICLRKTFFVIREKKNLYQYILQVLKEKSATLLYNYNLI